MDIEMTSVGWLGLPAIAILLSKVWRWVGTALPPATMIDEKYTGSPVEQQVSPIVQDTPDIPTEAQYVETVRIASDRMYLGAPLLETVRVRAWLIEWFLAALVMAVLVEVEKAQLQAVDDFVLAHPFISASVALTLFVLALLIGAVRQAFARLLSRAAAIPVIDGFGRPRFSYIGDVPPPSWQHSPWFRAVTWIPVAGGSLIAAWIGALLLNHFIDVGVALASIALLALRWLISAAPSVWYFSTIEEES